MRFLVTMMTRGAIPVLLGSCLVAQNAALPPSYQFSAMGVAPDIPVEVIADGLVLVHAQVNDHPGWFIVDNAVQGFIADRDFASRISLQESGKALTRGEAPNASEAGIVRDVRISLPGLELTHRVLVLINLKSLEPAIGHEVDGIIGSRLFDDFIVLMDYQHRSMSVYAPERYKPFADEEPIPVRVDEHGFLFLKATVALPGIAPLDGEYLVDSGSNSYLEVYKPYCDEHRLPPPGMKLLDALGTSADAITQSKDGRATRIDVGSFSIRNPPISFGEDVAGLMASNVHAGLLGAAFLQHFTVVYDSRGKHILLTPNRSYSDPPSYDQSGMRIHAEGLSFHRFVIGRVLPGSPAFEADIRPGDVIESLNRKSANEMTLTELRSMLTRPHARCSLGIIRGKSSRRVILQLRPLL
jgi:PDZ domain/Aspartyl protease